MVDSREKFYRFQKKFYGVFNFFFFSRSALPIVFAAAEVMKPDIGT